MLEESVKEESNSDVGVKIPTNFPFDSAGGARNGLGVGSLGWLAEVDMRLVWMGFWPAVG